MHVESIRIRLEERVDKAALRVCLLQKLRSLKLIGFMHDKASLSLSQSNNNSMILVTSYCLTTLALGKLDEGCFVFQSTLVEMLVTKVSKGLYSYAL